jgi:hypothetical protein
MSPELHYSTGRSYPSDIDPQIAIEERQTLDCSGHYARNDVFHLDVRREED